MRRDEQRHRGAAWLVASMSRVRDAMGSVLNDAAWLDVSGVPERDHARLLRSGRSNGGRGRAACHARSLV
jgi:hypothetical protein